MSGRTRPPNAHARRVIRQAKDMGFAWRFLGSGHLLFERQGVRVTASSSPRNADNWEKKVMSQLRRAAGGVTP